MKRWKNKIYLPILILIAWAFSSCQKDVDDIVRQSTLPDTIWHNNITPGMPISNLKAVLNPGVEIDTFSINPGAVSTYTTTAGLRVNIIPGMLLNTGQSATGLVKITSRLLLSKGDLIRADKPTVSNGRVLVSGGVMYVRLYQDEVPLTASTSMPLMLEYAGSPLDQSMGLFYGDSSVASTFNWLPAQDSMSNPVQIFGQNYRIYASHLGWINCDKFYDTSNIPQSKLALDLPSNYTNANSAAFVVFKNKRTVIELYGDAGTMQFRSGNLPAGEEITVVVLSMQGNDYFYGQTDAVIPSQSTGNYQTISLTPTITTLGVIENKLSAL